MKFILKVIGLLYCLFSATKGNPVLGLFDPSCFVVKDLSCPNQNVSFWLYTKETHDAPVKLDPLDISPLRFKRRRPIKIIIHGYTGGRDLAPNNFLRPKFLEHKDFYIISMDYGPLVRDPCYTSAVKNLPVASKCLAQLINNLVEQNMVSMEDIHLIGFSLGAQVAGQAANYVKKPLKHITGLDPSKTLFITVSLEKKLDKTDAEFVDVIHTDILGHGMLRALGHVDFYANLNVFQPGCEKEEKVALCNHRRAPRYYAESIYSEKGFWGYNCSSWFHYNFGLCYPNEQQEIMGLGVNKTSRGIYFLKTAAMSPFALGPVPFEASKQHKRILKYYNNKHIDDSSFEPELNLALATVLISNN